MIKHAPENLISITTAYVLADGHANGALLQFNELEKFARHHKKHNDASSPLQWMQRALPAAVSLALALELKLKVLYYQSHGRYPKTHDLPKMVDALPGHSTTVLAETYSRMYARDIYLNVVQFHFEWSGQSNAVHHPTKMDLSDLKIALQHVSGAYIKWRYIYEKMKSPEDTHINFWVLLCLIEAVSDAIQKFPGSIHVNFQGG